METAAPATGAEDHGSVFTIDVEDWFHILDTPSTPPLEAWARLESRVEANFRKLLALLGEADVRATCFFLGWVAEKLPHLVREAADAGHEIASHGYAHRLIFRQNRQEFLDDVSRAKKLLEDISGTPVWGFRAPGFSIVAQTPWALDCLAAAEYRYDTSIFPGSRGHGGQKGAPLAPYRIRRESGDIIEFPITLARVLGRRMCFFGGGYLRLFPFGVIRRMARRVHAEGRPVLYYIHPRDIDPDQPRLEMSAIRRFKSYVNIRTAECKLRRLLREFRFTPVSEWLERHMPAVGDAPMPEGGT